MGDNMSSDTPLKPPKSERLTRLFIRNFARERHLLVSLLAAIGWVWFFVIGYTVHAKPYEELLGEPNEVSISALVGAVVMFAMSSIPTNVLILSLFAGVLGTALRHAASADDQRPVVRADYTFGITGAFVVYLLILSGFLTLTVSDTMAAETAEKQIKLAAIGSLFSFVIAYDHSLIPRMLRRVADLFEKQVQENGNGESPDKPTPPARQPSTVAPSDLRFSTNSTRTAPHSELPA